MENINNKILVIIFLLFTKVTFCQIDTVEYYPLQKNNYWEYWGMQTFSSDLVKMTIEVKGDTLLENNKMYKIIQQNIYSDTVNLQATYYSYLRIDSNKIYKYGGASQSCNSLEYVYYDFNNSDSSIWQICPTYYANYRGIHSSKIFYIPLANITTTVRVFDYVNVSYIDTVWAPMSSPTTESIAKGIGLISEMDWDFAYFELYGLRIDGKVYGNITSTINRKTSVKGFELNQNYPNPFNPSTKITYSIPTSPFNPSPYQVEGNRERFVTLKVYDILGNEVASLVNEQKQPGHHSVEFNAIGLPSGVYFYQLLVSALQGKDGKVGSFIATKKMILMR